MKDQFRRFGVLMFVAILFPGSSLQAQTLSNLAGTWTGIAFSTPDRLTIMRSAAVFTNGPSHYSVVTNILEHNASDASLFQVDFLADGTLSTGEGSGTIVLAGQGAFNVFAGPNSLSFRVNSASDFAAGLGYNSDSISEGTVFMNELDLLVRQPASLTTNDLVGNWSVSTFETPQQLIQQYAGSSPVPGVTPLTDIKGKDNQSIGNSSYGGISAGSFTFNADGTLSGDVGGSFTGNFTVSLPGAVDINIPGDGVSFTGFINAGKDTLISVSTESSNNRQQIIVFTRNPTNVTLASLKGVWKVTSLNVPAQMSLSRDANNFITDVSGTSEFGVNQSSFTAGNDGFITAVFDGHPAIGALSTGPGSAMTLTFTNDVGSVQSHIGYLNAGTNVFSVVDNDVSISLVTRAAVSTSTNQELGLIMLGSKLYWAADSGRKLQRAGSPDGSWTDVAGTAGQHQYQISYTNTAEFYRVTQ